MAMEFLKGTELRTRMAKGAISVPEAVHIAEQVAEGLGYAHEHGVVHRDIKPSNIMLLTHDKVKIMDFGIARMRASDHKTSTGLVLGTPKYMSPEQVSGSPVDHRSDIFSLGVVLYEMLTHTKLFQGEDTPQIFHSAANFQPPTPRAATARISRGRRTRWAWRAGSGASRESAFCSFRFLRLRSSGARSRSSSPAYALFDLDARGLDERRVGGDLIPDVGVELLG